MQKLTLEYVKFSVKRISSALVIVIGLALPSVQAAPPVNLILNGDFETGTFVDWTVVNTGASGNWNINNGTFDPSGPGAALPPVSGKYDAVSSQTGSSKQLLEQTIDVPDNIFSASLTWNDRVRNFAGLFLEPQQEWRVVIRDTSGNLLHEVFSTTPGDPALQVGPNSRSGNLTGVLQTLAGQTIVVSFEGEAGLYYINATLDDVKLLVSTLPISRDECRNRGWSTFVNVVTDKRIFKNQGDCVSFVATKGRNSSDLF